MSTIPVVALLVLGLFSFTLPSGAFFLAPSATTTQSGVSVSGGGGTGGSYNASGSISINIHLGFNYDLSWFLTPLQGVLNAYGALFKILYAIVDVKYKAAIDLFSSSFYASFVILSDVTVYSVEQLFELIAKVFAQLDIAIKAGYALMDLLVSGFNFVASAQLKIVLSLLEGFSAIVKVFLSKPPPSSVNVKIGFQTELGDKYIANLTATFQGWGSLRTSLNSAVNNKTNASIIDFQASVNAALLLVSNVTVKNNTELLNLLFSFGNSLGIVYVKYEALYQLLIDGGFTSVATNLKAFYVQVVYLLRFTFAFIGSQTKTSNETGADLKFVIGVSTALGASIQKSFETIYGYNVAVKGIISYIGTTKFSDNITRFEDSIDVIINQLKGVTVNDENQLTSLLTTVRVQLQTSISYAVALITGYADAALYTMTGVFWQFRYYLNDTLNLSGNYLDGRSTGPTIAPTGPTAPTTSPSDGGYGDVKLVFGFEYQFQAQLLLILNGAYKAYGVWKAALVGVTDATLKAAIVTLEGSIDAAFAIIVGKTVASYDVLVQILIQFVAKFSVIIETGNELQAKFLQSGQLVIVAAFKLAFSVFAGLYVAISKLVPEVSTNVTTSSGVITTTSPSTGPFGLVITIEFDRNTEFIGRIESSFNTVYGWDADVSSTGGSFLVQIRAWIQVIVAVFDIFKGKTFSDLNALDVAVEAFMVKLDEVIVSGKALLQQIQDGNGSAELIAKINGYISFLVDLRAYISGFDDYVHGLRGTSSTPTGVTVTTSKGSGGGEVGLIFGFEYQFQAQLLLILNGAYKAYGVWKAALVGVTDATLKAAIVTLEGSIDAAFALIVGKTVASYDVLVQILIQFVAKFSVIIETGNELQAKFLQSGQLVIVAAFKLAFSVFAGLYVTISKLVPEVSTNVTTSSGVITTTSPSTGPFGLVITIEFDRNTEFIGRIESSFNTVYGWDADVSSTGGSFLVQIRAWIQVVVAVFDIFKGKTFSDLNALDVAVEAFMVKLDEVIVSGKALLQQIQDGNGSAELIAKINGYISFLMDLRVYIGGFDDYVHGLRGTSSTPTGVTVTTSKGSGGGEVGLIFGFNFALEAELLLIINGAYKAYGVWKSAVGIVIDVTLKSAIATLEGKIDAAFAILGVTVDSYEALVAVLVKFVAQINVVVQAATDLEAKFQQSGQLLIVAAFKVCFSLFGGLFVAISKLVPELSATTTTVGTPTTPTSPTFSLVINFDFDRKDEFITRINNSYQTVYGWDNDVRSVAGTFLVQIEAWLAVDINIFGVFNGQTIADWKALDVAVEKFMADLKVQIQSGKTLLQDIKDGNGSAELTAKFEGYVNFLVDLLAYITGFDNYIHGYLLSTVSPTVPDITTPGPTGPSVTPKSDNLDFKITIVGFELAAVIEVVFNGAFAAFKTLEVAIKSVTAGSFQVQIDAFLKIVVELFAIVQGKTVENMDALYALFIQFSAKLKIVIEETQKLSGQLLGGGLFTLNVAFNVFVAVLIRFSASLDGYIIATNPSSTLSSVITTTNKPDETFTFIINFVVEGSADFVARITSSFDEVGNWEETISLVDVGDYSERITAWIQIVVELFGVLNGKTAGTLEVLIQLVGDFKTKLDAAVDDGQTLLTDIKDNDGSEELISTFTGFVDFLVDLQTYVTDFYNKIDSTDVTTETGVITSSTSKPGKIVINLPGTEVITGAINLALEGYFAFESAIRFVAGGLGSFAGQVTSLLDLVGNLFALIQGKVFDTVEAFVAVLLSFSAQLKVVVETATKLKADLIAGGFYLAGETFQVFLAVFIKLTAEIELYISEHTNTGPTGPSVPTGPTGPSVPTGPTGPSVTPKSDNLDFVIKIVDFELAAVIEVVFNGAFAAFKTLEVAITSVTAGSFQVQIDAFLKIVVELFAIVQGKTVENMDALYALFIQFSAKLKIVIEETQKLSGQLLGGGLFTLNVAFNVFVAVLIRFSASLDGYIIATNPSSTLSSVITTTNTPDETFTFIINFVVEGSADFVARITSSFDEVGNWEETISLVDVGDFSERITAWIQIVVELFGVLNGKTAGTLEVLIQLVGDFKTKLDAAVDDGQTLLTDIKDNDGSEELISMFTGFVDFLVELQTYVTDFYNKIDSTDVTTETGVITSSSSKPGRIVINLPGTEVIAVAINLAYDAYFAFESAIRFVAGGLGSFAGQVTSLLDLIDKLFALIQGKVFDTVEAFVSVLFTFTAQLKVIVETATKLKADLIAGGFFVVGTTFDVFIAAFVKLTAEIELFVNQNTLTTRNGSTVTTETPTGNDLNFVVDFDSTIAKQLAFFYEATYKFYLTYKTKLSSATEVANFEEDLKTFLDSVDAAFDSLKDQTVDSEDSLKELLVTVSGEFTTAITNGQTLFEDLWGEGEGSYEVATGVKFFLSYLDVSLKIANNINSDVTECKCV